MKEIKNVDLSRFLQNQDFGFHSIAISEISTCTDEKVTGLTTKYRTCFQKFDEVLKTGGGNPMTKQIADADSLQDKLYRGLAAQNKTMLNHFDPVKAEIARNVDLILKRNGNPCSLPYLQEDSVIKNLIQDLEAFNNPEDDRPEIESVDEKTGDGPATVQIEGVTGRLAKIGLLEWKEQLKAANINFMALYSSRNAQDAQVIAGATTEARKAADQAYYDVVKRINALININGEEDYLTIVNNLNQLIDKELAVVATRQTATAKRKKKEDSEMPSDRPVIE